MNNKFSVTVVGGTFDRLHKGHKALLDQAIQNTDTIIIGLTTDNMHGAKEFSSIIEHYSEREKNVLDYLRSKKFMNEIAILPITDTLGITTEQKNIDVIFVTEENVMTAKMINSEREKRNFPPLKIITVPYAYSKDGQIISSHRIRKGEIDREGNVYKNLFHEKVLLLPDTLRQTLRNPIGVVTKDTSLVEDYFNKAVQVISVGDVVSMDLAEQGNQADISIIDFKTRRKEIDKLKNNYASFLSTADYATQNKAGTIELDAAETVYAAVHAFQKFDRKQIIHVDGEEDLLTFPAILFAPLNSLVIYGQYNEGAVLVEVTEKKKKQVQALLNKFKIKNLTFNS